MAGFVGGLMPYTTATRAYATATNGRRFHSLVTVAGGYYQFVKLPSAR